MKTDRGNENMVFRSPHSEFGTPRSLRVRHSLPDGVEYPEDQQRDRENSLHGEHEIFMLFTCCCEYY